jgi:hypothetical protein
MAYPAGNRLSKEVVGSRGAGCGDGCGAGGGGVSSMIAGG